MTTITINDDKTVKIVADGVTYAGTLIYGDATPNMISNSITAELQIGNLHKESENG